MNYKRYTVEVQCGLYNDGTTSWLIILETDDAKEALARWERVTADGEACRIWADEVR